MIRYLLLFVAGSALAPIAADTTKPWQTIPDERQWLTETYLPSLEGKVLYIGVGSYTTQYHTRVKSPHLFETIDYLEERAHWGSPYKHYVGDIVTFQSDYLYDHVSFFGILGYHVEKYGPFNSEESIDQVLDKVDSLVRVGGTLQIGANHSLKPPYDTAYWKKKIEEHYSSKYETLVQGVSPYNVIWYGRKVFD